MSEKVFSCSMSQRFGGEATGLESTRLVVEEVDDEIEDLWREGRRHRGLREN